MLPVVDEDLKNVLVVGLSFGQPTPVYCQMKVLQSILKLVDLVELVHIFDGELNENFLVVVDSHRLSARF